jgi:integrase
MPLHLWRRSDGRSSNWYVVGTVTVWRDGRKRSLRINPESTGTSDRAEAGAILAQVAGRYQRGNIENRDAPPTVSDLVHAYLDAGKSARYLTPIVNAIGPLEVGELTQELIDREGRKAYPGAAPPTLRRQWHGVINAVLRHSRHRIDLSLPAASRATTRWVAPAVADEIIRQCAAGRYRDPWAPALAEFLFGSGCRAGEAMDIDAADVHLDYKVAIFRRTKNEHERTVHLPDRCIAALGRLPNIAEPGKLFRRGDGEAYREPKFNAGYKLQVLRTAAERAGVEFNPHMTRHSFATWFYCQTKDRLRLKDQGGWRTDSAMERYTHLAHPKIGEDAIALGWDFRWRAIETPADERKQA